VLRLSQKNRSQRAEDTDEERPRRGKPRKIEAEVEEESNESPEQNEDESNSVRKQKVDDIVRYLLIAHQSKKAVQRADLTRQCLGRDNAHLFNVVFEDAKKKLRYIFGIEVVQSEERRGYYYLSNTLRHV